MYEQINSALGENSWLLAVATVVFFTIKGLLWLVVPVIAFRCKRWFVRTDRLAIRKR